MNAELEKRITEFRERMRKEGFSTKEAAARLFAYFESFPCRQSELVERRNRSIVRKHGRRRGRIKMKKTEFKIDFCISKERICPYWRNKQCNFYRKMIPVDDVFSSELKKPEFCHVEKVVVFEKDEEIL